MSNTTPDIRAENHGSIWLVRAFTPQGTEWLDDNVAFEHFFGGAGVVEWRYVGEILRGAQHDGLAVSVLR